MLEEILHILENSRARRRVPGRDVWLLDSGAWWRFGSDAKRLEQTKGAILTAAWRLPCSLYLEPAEDPLDSELAPFVRREGAAWRIEKTAKVNEFYRTEQISVLGSWRLCGSEAPPSIHLPDAFRTKPEELLALMARQRAHLLIDAFHDDTDWCVALSE